MPNWTRLSAPAAGAFSASWITRIGALLLAVVLGGAFLVQSCFSSAPTDPESLIEAEGIAGDRTERELSQRVQDIETRAELDAAAAARTLATEGTQLAGGHVTPAFNPTTGETLPDGTAPGIVPRTEDEAQLRELLRLEAIERRTRSLRSPPVVITYRLPGGLPPAAAATAAPAQAGGPTDTPASSADIAQPVSLAETVAALAAMDIEQTGGIDPTSMLPIGLQQIPPSPPDPSGLGAPPGAAVPQGDPSNPAIVRTPNDPPGWDRIYEGSFLEGVLVTQLNGDFPSPVLAAVSVPYYSADRQRMVIPRGARVVGSASATVGQDQERLAVGFHRLIFPDGRWVSLEFRGLNQLGEGALKDRVNRHYFSMFAAVGAVGIISGLTLRGSDPYAGGRQGFQAGAGQGLAQGATSILDRFLNRLPTITIRAGHRLRIWLTSDVLVPRSI